MLFWLIMALVNVVPIAIALTFYYRADNCDSRGLAAAGLWLAGVLAFGDLVALFLRHLIH